MSGLINNPLFQQMIAPNGSTEGENLNDTFDIDAQSGKWGKGILMSKLKRR